MLKDDIKLLKNQIKILYDIIDHNKETIAAIKTDNDDLSKGVQAIIQILFEKNTITQDDLDLVLSSMKI